MTRPYQVRITRRAERDLKRIYKWIRRRSPDGANRWQSAAYDAIFALELNPEMCSIADESVDSDVTLRNRNFSTRKGNTYRAVFFIEYGIVFVTHVRGPGQPNIPARELP